MKRTGGVIAALALLLLVAIGLGIGYEQVQRQRDRQRYPQVGRSVDIGGRSLNIFCSGEGSPAVILESDALRPGYSWVFIQRELARETRACWYDRAGYGWSDPGPTPHISASSAADLHELLRRSGVQPPYLMVGDGFGSLNVRVYRGLYPQEVAGMVLLDPIDEGEEQMGMASRVPFHLGYPPGFVLRAVNRVGLMRLFPRARPQAVAPRRLTSEEQDTLSGLEGEPKMHAAFLAEQGFSRSLEEVRSSGGLGNLPLVVVRGSSSQRMQSEAPEAVVQSVLKLVEALRHQ